MLLISRVICIHLKVVPGTSQTNVKEGHANYSASRGIRDVNTGYSAHAMIVNSEKYTKVVGITFIQHCSGCTLMP